jgi:hypothetical protein
MDIENHSPFPQTGFEKGTTKGQFFDVIVVAGSFGLEHGQPLYPMAVHQPIVSADRYVGEPETTALLEETHLVVAKRRTDIHLLGHAQSVDNKPRASWEMGFALGNVKKTARLTGVRGWGWTPVGGWSLSAPTPTEQVALHSGNAYGGYLSKRVEARTDEAIDRYNSEQSDTYLINPVGLGYTGEAALERAAFYRAAQIEAITSPINDIHKTYAPVCFGPRARWCADRIALAGTYDDIWRNQHFPYLPPDFDFAFYQSAQPDLISPEFLQGDEKLALIGCTESGELKSQLPGIRLMAILTDDSGYRESVGMRLDTVSIDLDERVVQLVWRLTVAKSWQLRHAMIAAIPNGASQPDPTKPVYFHRGSPLHLSPPSPPSQSGPVDG